MRADRDHRKRPHAIRRALPLGSYAGEPSWLNGIDARCKLAALALLAIGAFATGSPWGLLAELVVLCLLACVCHVSPMQLARALRPTVIVLAFAVMANALVVSGQLDAQLAGPVGISFVGLGRACAAVFRIVLLVGFVLVVAATTTAPEISSASVTLLRPLARLGVPIADVAMVVSVALRFIPETAAEFDRIEMAQRARGARFDQGTLRERLSKWVAVLVPLVVALFRRSDELARAMGDRCYADGTSQLRPRRLVWRDWLFLAVMLAVAVACVLL